MNKVTAQRLEMVRELADAQGPFGDYFSTEWAHNDDGDRLMQSAKRLFMIDTDDIQALQEAHKLFLQAVMDASGIDDDDAMDALDAIDNGYREAVTSREAA